MPTRQFWLVKSEPEVFSFDDLTKAPKKTTHWNGVRNFAARNHLKSMQKGDLVFFYHSMAKPAADPHAGHVMPQQPAPATAPAQRNPNLPPDANAATAQLTASPRHGEWADSKRSNGGAPRTIMSWIAMAAWVALCRCRSAYSNGSRVWSITATVPASSARKIVRQGLP
jgi:hypothetical protein